MNIQQLREHVERFIAQPAEQMGRWARFLRGQVMLWRYCARRLYEHNVAVMAAALSYRTIFAMIPVMVLALLIARSLGALEDGRQSLQQFLKASGFNQIVAVQEEARPGERPSGEPATESTARSINVAEEIEKIVLRVENKLTFARIGPVGGLLLIWTAVSLMTSMESALNRIFGAFRGRSLVRRLLLYWSALTLGPVLLAAASYLGGLSIEAFQRIGGPSRLLLALIGWVGPALVTVLVIAALYKLVPNTRVSFRSAIGGAAVATVLWLVAKWAFALYVDRLVLKGNLYGLLGVLPLFLLWLYCSWLIFLFGAELAHTAANLTEIETAEQAMRLTLGPSDLLAAALVVAHFYAAGRGPVPLDEVVSHLKLPPGATRNLLDRLEDAGVLATVEQGSQTHYLPAQPPERIAVQKILEIADPAGAADAPRHHDGFVGRALADMHARTRQATGSMTLATLLENLDA